MQQSNYCGLPNSPHFPPVASKRVVTPLHQTGRKWRGK